MITITYAYAALFLFLWTVAVFGITSYLWMWLNRRR